MYFRFQFFIRKPDKSLCTSLIIRIKSILMIEMYRNVIRYKRDHGLHYANKNVNSATTLEMAQISFNQITVETLFCLMSTLEN